MLSRFTLWWRVCDGLKNKEGLIYLLRLLQQLLLVSFFLFSITFFPDALKETITYDLILTGILSMTD